MKLIKKKRKDVVLDSDFVNYIQGDPSINPEVIPFMYGNGILKAHQPVDCSRWGIHFRPDATLDFDQRIIAIHEVGHAIVFMGRGAKFRYIELGGSFGEGGHIEQITGKNLPSKGSEEYWEHADSRAIAMVGGPAATSMLLHNNTTTWDYGADDDFVLLCDLERINSYKVVELIVLEGTAIVEKRWNVVEAIAAELLKYKRIRYAQCMRIAEKISGKA